MPYSIKLSGVFSLELPDGVSLSNSLIFTRLRSIEILSIVAISLFCLLGVFLLSSSNARQKGFGWLGLFFLLLAINYLDGILLINGVMFQVSRLAFWEDPFVLLYGPLIYSFSLHLKNGKRGFNRATVIHFIPFVLLELGVLSYHLRSSVEQTQELLSIIVSEQLNFTAFLLFLPFFGHVMVYILLALSTLARHQANLKQYYSTIEINWAFSLIRMVLALFIISLFSTLVQFTGTREVFFIALIVLIFTSIVLTLRILLYAMNQPIFHPVVKPEPAFSLPAAEKEKLAEKIDEIIREKQLFINPKLTLKDLAIQTGHSERAISYVINDAMADNFYDLINNYRIEAAKQILVTNRDPKLTILEVLYQVGFNSKSSFNTQFRKKTGLTPTEFRRQQQRG